jgi:hypothetical protein
MKLLDACLALALTLAVFASSATVLVELLQRALRRRVKQLRAMIGVVFDRYLAGPLAAAGADVAALRTSFIDEVGQRHGVRQMLAAERRPADAPAAPTAPAAPVERVTVEDLLRRLARSPAFRAALARVEAKTLRPALEALAAGFAHLEADASALFAERARLLSNLCGIFLALAVNVDAVRLFDHYASDPVGAAQTVAALAAARPSGGAQPQADAEAEQRIAATIDELRGLAAVGVPVGAAYFPYCSPPAGQARIDPRCAKDLTGWAAFQAAVAAQPLDAFFWLLRVLVTGLLIGLGGPYWFDLVMALSRWREILRGLGGRGGQAPAEPAAISARTVPPSATARRASFARPPCSAVASSEPTFQTWIDEIVARGPSPASAAPAPENGQ